MVNHYVHLHSFFSKTVSPELQTFTLEKRTLKAMFIILENLAALTKVFKTMSVNLYAVREYINTAMKIFPEHKVHCVGYSKIVKHVEIEYAVAKNIGSQLWNKAFSSSHNGKIFVKKILKQEKLAGRRYLV